MMEFYPHHPLLAEGIKDGGAPSKVQLFQEYF